MIGLCTDSNSQLPAELADRYGIEVVPLTVIVDGQDYLEGVDLDADQFYDSFTPTHRPEVSTCQPSPGQFAAAYDDLVSRGCTEILSVHVSAAVSGTLNAARLAAKAVPVPVRLVDSGTASFGVSCCVWAAGDAIAAGASLDKAAAIAETVGPTVGNVFIVGALDLVRSGGRAEAIFDLVDEAVDEAVDKAVDAKGVPVLSLIDGRVQVIDRVATMDEAVAAMASFAVGHGERLRVAIGVADRQAAPISAALEAALIGADNVVDVVHYRVGPSIGAHTGPGTAGCFMYPVA